MSIGFKEWAIVGEVMERGEQSILLRKGGIAEGRDGFRFQHEAFFLFPTFFHEQIGRTTLPVETPLPHAAAGQVAIRLFARIEWTTLITDWATVQRLAPFHCWREAVVEERFHYAKPSDAIAASGIHLAMLRLYRLAEPWCFADSPTYGGCRSWVELPEPPPGLAWRPVLDDATHAARVAAIRGVL
jgi:hypothetical protein